MARRTALLLVLVTLAAMALGAASAGATRFAHTQWDVSIDGRQTVTWSFAADKPENCPAYYGEASQKAQGSGSISMSFATKKKEPLWAETYLSGNKLVFLSFATEGWKIPAIYSKRGTFSVIAGMPCGSGPDDPAPLPKIADTSECGSEKTVMRPSLDWERGELVLRGDIALSYKYGCPGPFEQEMNVDTESPCTPRDMMSGIGGSPLQELNNDVSSDEFLRGKAFSVDANQKFHCRFPSSWPGEPPLKLELSTRYEVSFKPRSH